MVVLDDVHRSRSDVAVTRFEHVFRQCYRPMYALTSRLLGDPHETEDVLQDVFLRLSDAPVLDRPDDEVAAWLRRACLNAGLNALRGRQRASRRLARAARLDVAGGDEGSPLPDLLRQEEQQAVRRALASLPDRQGDCLLLRYSGHSYAEIAATLGIAVGSVGVLLARAERAFRHIYEMQESQR